MTNPYQSPPETHTDRPRQSVRSTVGLEFQADWSPEGLKRRRRSEWNRVLDVAFALLSLLWIGSLLISTGSPYTGIFCVLTPMWVILAIVWFSNLTFRTGDAFHKKYLGFSGPVRGRVDERMIVVHGPSVSLAARVSRCLQCSASPQRAILQPPGFETTLPIAADDIVRTWPTTPLLSKVTQAELLHELCPELNAIRLDGMLYGSDLKSFSRWKIWRWSGWLLIGLGTAAVGWALLRALTLPSWILNPPDHYHLSDEDMSQLVGPAVLSIIGVGFLIAGCWQWARTWRRLGRYAITIDRQHICIASHSITLAYHHDALQHFEWTTDGLIAKGAGRQFFFALPARWFDDDHKALLEAWFGRRATPPVRSYFLGPKL